MGDTYTTPEGFELYKPLVFPDVRDFAELFTVERAWDFETMNHRNGDPQPDTPPNITRDGFTRWSGYTDEINVGRFLATRNLPNVPHLMVTPTQMVLDVIFDRDRLEFAFFDHVSWEAIYHERNDRVLVTASASRILATRWVAYIDPATIPEVTA